MANEDCKRFLNVIRRVIGAKKEEKINKRYRGRKAYNAPNGMIYFAHCGYCAEIQYLYDIYDVNMRTKIYCLEEAENERA